MEEESNLRLVVQPRLAVNSCPSYHSVFSVGITGRGHHDQLMGLFDIEVEGLRGQPSPKV